MFNLSNLFFLLSHSIVDISPVDFPSSESALATHGHQFVRREGSAEVGVVSMIKHFSRFIPEKGNEANQV